MSKVLVREEAEIILSSRTVKKAAYYILMLVLPLMALNACSDYNKVLKSTDYEYKYKKALEYYDKKEYGRALPLFEELVPLMRLTSKAENIYYHYSWCHYYLKEYYLAAYYFKNFTKTFPTSKYAEECFYMSALCNVRNSPPTSLDQSETITAIQGLQLFLNRYPESNKRDTCNQIIDRLRGKLELKAWDNARLYFQIENYKAASVAIKAMLEEYPDSRYREEALFMTLKSDFLLAVNSIDEKKRERFNETLKSFSTFVDSFPDSRYKKEAIRLYEDTLKEIENLGKANP